jgi:MobA/VirD2-like, nuclease domain
MIVKIGGGGKSFKGLSTYLTHDPEANSDERVAWTHTHNLANDHVPSAVDEMVWTARNAELLKQENGVRAGGRATETPVKHISLNWAPDDNPTREHMIETTEGFLCHMNWHELQAVLVAHDDKTYRHVHVMLNTVHPETGLRLNDDFERRRAQAWALDYERQQGHIHCEQRLGNVEDREKAMPRNIWMAFQENEKEFQRTEKMRGENRDIRENPPENPKNSEWKILKELQRVERQEFFAQGKSEFSKLRTLIYREVREEFRERWNDYYKAEKLGTEADRYIRDAVKVELVTDQKAVLETRRDAACLELRASRAARYREILDCQAEMRADLKWHQEVGLDSAPFFRELAERKDAGKEVTSGFRDAAGEVTEPQRSEVDAREATPAEDDEPVGRPGRSVEHIVGRVGAAGVSLLDSLFFDLTTLGGGPTDPHSRSNTELFQAAADETQKRQQYELEERDDAGQLRQKALNGE